MLDFFGVPPDVCRRLRRTISSSSTSRTCRGPGRWLRSFRSRLCWLVGSHTLLGAHFAGDRLAHGGHDLVNLLVLPEPQYLPSRLRQQLVVPPITATFASSFTAHQASLVAGRRRVRRTPMPEAPVELNGHSPPGEGDVDLTPGALQRPVVLAEPQTGRVEP